MNIAFGKMLKGFLILGFLLIFGAGCKTPDNQKTKKPAKAKTETRDADFVKKYSELLGVKLNGNENKKMLEVLVQWLGTPYKYGGTTKSGTDCSGMVMAVFKEVYNKDLFRSSYDQLKNVRLIEQNELKTGDLVFFKISGNKVSHVGIYIGEQKFIHSSTSKGVVINSLEEPYYKKYFFSGGRVLGVE